jgi:hypothetical protein
MNGGRFLPWSGLSEQEKRVWTASFASQTADAFTAARVAEQAVARLRTLELDTPTGLDPEY